MRFSERHGHKSVRDSLQIESVDDDLRNGLWSVLELHAWNQVHLGHSTSLEYDKDMTALCRRLWLHYFKKPLDTLGYDWQNIRAKLRDYFFSCEWFEVYDFIEFVAQNYGRYEARENIESSCNYRLEAEMAGYRFVDGQITPITDELEILEIENAVGATSQPVATHLRRALELLSDRDKPDYRNSIKESISAVESLVAMEVGAKKGTLGQLLKKMEEGTGLHPALKEAFSNLYGYTSDKDGIRHKLLEADSVDFHDAKFMLVTCSTFVNYVVGKKQ